MPTNPTTSDVRSALNKAVAETAAALDPNDPDSVDSLARLADSAARFAGQALSATRYLDSREAK